MVKLSFPPLLKVTPFTYINLICIHVCIIQLYLCYVHISLFYPFIYIPFSSPLIIVYNSVQSIYLHVDSSSRSTITSYYSTCTVHVYLTVPHNRRQLPLLLLMLSFDKIQMASSAVTTGISGLTVKERKCHWRLI